MLQYCLLALSATIIPPCRCQLDCVSPFPAANAGAYSSEEDGDGEYGKYLGLSWYLGLPG